MTINKIPDLALCDFDLKAIYKQRLSCHFDCERSSDQKTVMVSEIPDFEYRKEFFTLDTLVQTFNYSNVNINIKNFPFYRQIFQKIVSQDRTRYIVA